MHCLKPPHLLALAIIAASAIAFAEAPSDRNHVPLSLSANPRDGSYTLSAVGIEGPVLHASIAIKVNGKWLHASDYPEHLVSRAAESGELGPALATTIRYTGLQNAPDLLVKFRTYTDRPFGDMQVTALNSSSTSFQIQSFRLLEAGGESVIHLGRDAAADRVLSDSFSEDRPAMQIRDLTNAENHVHRAVGLQLLYNRQSGQSWFIGALTSNKFLSVLRLHMRQVGGQAKGQEVMGSYEVDSTGTTEMLSENSLLDSSANDRVELSQPLSQNGELSSERMLFGVSSDYHDQLITYAHLVRDLHHARVTAPTPMGWWSWTAFYFGLNEGIAQTNADWLSQHLKPLGYTFFHMDEGYQFARGEYATPDASLFPSGVSALEHKVLNAGLTPGIWTAPFEVSERSWIYSHHPEWLVKNAQGEPIHIGKVVDGIDRLFALDATNPGAQAYLRDTYSTLVNQWGIRYIKMDFMEDSAVEGVYFRPQTTALEAQRIGIETIRDAVGQDVLLDKDGCELLNPVGLVDMGRISQDTGHTFSASRDAAPGIAARYYMNRNFFLADPDAFSISKQTIHDQDWHGGEKPLTLDEAKVSIALSTVSGGLFEIGDDLPTLGEESDRVALVEDKDLLDTARLGHASVPLDLMSYDAQDLEPSIFLLKQTSRQSMLTVFNWTETSRDHTLTRQSLDLAPSGDYTISEVLTPDEHPVSIGASFEIKQVAHSVRMFKIINTKIPAQAPPVNIEVASAAKTGEAVSFSAVSSDDDNPVLQCEWDFGDGVSFEGAKLHHTYTHDGVFSAHLKATGFAGELSSKAVTITVTGALNTKYAPQDKRRFVERLP